MTDRRPDQGFSVAPRELGRSRARRHPLRRFAVPVVVAIAGGLIALGWLGPRLGERPHLDVAYFATPTPLATATPTPTPRPTANLGGSDATPLPAVTRNDDGRLASHIGIFGDGFRVADLATGRITPSMSLNQGLDTLVRAPSGSGWVCICMIDVGDELGNVTRDVQFVRIAPDGSEINRSRLLLLGEGTAGLVSIQSDVDIAANGRTAILAFLEVSRTDWTYAVAPLDLATGVLSPVVRIATEQPPPLPPNAPSPTPAPEGQPSFPTSRININGPTVRIAPDGERAFVWASEQVARDDGTGPFIVRGWKLGLGGSGAGVEVAAAPAFADLPIYCGTAAFFTGDRFVAFCAGFPTDGTEQERPTWTYLALDREGHMTGHNQLTNVGTWGSDVLFDIANGAAWLWDSTDLSLARIDLSSLVVDRTKYAPDVEVATGSAKIGGVSPVWFKPGLPTAHGFGAQMAGSPDGTRLYLLGFAAEQDPGAQQQQSIGVFVVDTATESLVGRWHADATYVTIQPALGGSVVVATGLPGVDERAFQAQWDASLTFHDASDGRILLRLGQIGQAYGASVLEP